MSKQPPPDPIYILRGSTSPITCLHSPADSTTGSLFAGNQDGQVLIWDLKSKRLRESLNAHQHSSVLWVQTLENNCILSQGRDGKVILWKCLQSEWTKSNEFTCCSQVFCHSTVFYQNDLRYIVLPSNKASTLDVINIDTNQVISTLKSKDGEYGMCMCLKYAGTGNHDNQPILLVAYESGMLLLWDIFAKEIVDKLEIFQDSIMCMDYSEQFSKGVCGSVNNKLITFKLDNMKLIKERTIEVVNDGFSSLTIRPDNKLVVSTGWDGVIRLFSLKSWKPLAILQYHKESVQCSTFTSDNILMCGGKDKLISIWKIYS